MKQTKYKFEIFHRGRKVGETYAVSVSKAINNY